MRYALLIYQDEAGAAAPDTEDAQRIYGEYAAFSEQLEAREARLGGEALVGIEAATTVRVRNGEAITTDGPFAETKEQLGGFSDSGSYSINRIRVVIQSIRTQVSKMSILPSLCDAYGCICRCRCHPFGDGNSIINTEISSVCAYVCVYCPTCVHACTRCVRVLE